MNIIDFEDRLQSAARLMKLFYPILTCGNGGSAADAMHLTTELVGRFKRERAPINSVCLCANAALMSAIANDYGYQETFVRQVEAWRPSTFSLICFSTSGTAVNVVNAAGYAWNNNNPVISFTGHSGGDLKQYSRVLLNVPSDDTPEIQQMHIVLYHRLCELLEE